MTTDAIVFMVSVWTVVTFLTGYCFFKILVSKKAFGLDDETADHIMETPSGEFLANPEDAEKIRSGEPTDDKRGDITTDEFRAGDPHND